MSFLKSAGFCVIALAATAACSAQQKFPLRSGEWEATTPASGPADKPMVMLYCLNDEMWTKALTQNPSCSIQQLNVASRGATYSMDCPMKSFQMKGKVEMVFDGATHMVGKGSFDMTLNGKTTHALSQSDYRWKGPTCSPNDANMRAHTAH